MYYIMDKQRFIMELPQFFDEAERYDILFVGENHGAQETHDAERIILTGLSERHPNLVLALEMFERDVQAVLDDYLTGSLPENQFLELARPWPNYQEDYRPLIEFAKANSISVIAANVPRRAAAAVAAANEVSADVMGVDSDDLPDTLHLDSADYFERFKAMIQGMSDAAPMKRMHIDGLYKAQVLKDAVMAASLEPFLDRPILFCCGQFHCDYHLGIPYQLEKNFPGLNIAVITFASYNEQVPMSELSRMGDYIWIEE